MKRLYVPFVICFALIFVACSDKKDDLPPPEVDRTVLVYLAADNNLSPNARKNLEEMVAGMRGVSGNLIVYLDARGSAPQLIQVLHTGSWKVIEEYAKENSASPEVMSRVLHRTMALYPAKSYGLVLWSHGNGWKPATIEMGLRAAVGRDIWQKDPDALQTKWFGQDATAGSFMDISVLASVLPKDRTFDFLLFDACLMSSIEALYDLRHAAKYIIASPNEVMSTGFPYTTIVPAFFAETLYPDQICKLFMTAYRGSSTPWASVALIKTDELESLALRAGAYLATTTPNETVASQVQFLENMSAHVYYDMEDYYVKLAGDPGALAAFQQQLHKTVRYSDHTDQIYSAYSGSNGHMIPINHFSGLSAYIPRTNPALTSMTSYYYQTSWAKAVGLSD